MPGVLEQPGALARHIGDQGDAVLVDQVETRERTPEADAAVDHDVTIAVSAERINFLGEVAAGDGGIGPVGGRERAGEHHLGRGIEGLRVGIVSSRREVTGHALVGDPAHDVHVRARVELAPAGVLRRVVRQIAAELEELGPLGGDHAVE